MYVLTKLNTAILVSVFILNISSTKLPPGIKRCRKSDSHLNKCLDKYVMDALRQLQGGNKDLGIIPLEPLVIPKLELGSTNLKGINLQQIYENFSLYGLTNSTIFYSNANFGDTNCYWRFKAKTNRMKIKSNYSISGQLLLFPINGHGKAVITLSGSVSTYKIECEKYTKNNKKHIRVTRFELGSRHKKVVFDFDNIIDGNKKMSREIVKTMNENALQIIEEIGPMFDDAIARVEKETMNRVFSIVPEDELFLP